MFIEKLKNRFLFSVLIVLFTFLGNKAVVEAKILINEDNFPDENFRNYIIDSVYGCYYDTKEDTWCLNEGDIQYVKYIICQGSSDENGGIVSLKGIELFPELEGLNCDYNQLTELDLSKNLKLTSLHCSNNQLKELDISNNALLKTVFCTNNQLTDIKTGELNNLDWFFCEKNQLTNLDLCKAVHLKKLSCGNNKLTQIDLSKNTELEMLLFSYGDAIEVIEPLWLREKFAEKSRIMCDMYKV